MVKTFKRSFELERAARGQHVLVGDVLAVVVVRAGRVDHLAEAIALEIRRGGAEVNVLIHDGCGEAHFLIELAVVTGDDRGRCGRRSHDVAADVLDRAGDGVLAVERALRPAQHLDAIDVVDIEQRRLRARQVHIIEVYAHSRLEPPQGV